MTVPLVTGEAAETERNYTVKLYFAELVATAKGQRVFDVLVQGQRVIEDFDVVGAARGPRKLVVKQVQGVKAGTEMTFRFEAKRAEPLICGIEIVAEGR